MPQVYNVTQGTSNLNRHFKTVYSLVSDNEILDDDVLSIHSQLIASSTLFKASIFKSKLLKYIAVCHLSFSIIERDEFRDLMLYSSLNLRRNNTLLKSNSIIKILLF
jgi:hypothetical protein